MVFTVYAPAVIEKQAILRHLEDMREYVQVLAPEAREELLEFYGD